MTRENYFEARELDRSILDLDDIERLCSHPNNIMYVMQQIGRYNHEKEMNNNQDCKINIDDFSDIMEVIIKRISSKKEELIKRFELL